MKAASGEKSYRAPAVTAENVGKQLDLLKTMLPRFSRVAILACGTIGGNARKIVAETGVREIHMRASRLPAVVNALSEA